MQIRRGGSRDGPGRGRRRRRSPSCGARSREPAPTCAGRRRRISNRRLFGIDRSGPTARRRPCPASRCNPWTIPNAIGFVAARADPGVPGHRALERRRPGRARRRALRGDRLVRLPRWLRRAADRPVQPPRRAARSARRPAARSSRAWSSPGTSRCSPGGRSRSSSPASCSCSCSAAMRWPRHRDPDQLAGTARGGADRRCAVLRDGRRPLAGADPVVRRHGAGCCDVCTCVAARAMRARRAAEEDAPA